MVAALAADAEWMVRGGAVLAAALGAAVGSFVNVVAYRLPRGLSVVRPRRSFCPACERPIRAGDNVPILGWLRLGGRCRDCGAPIDIVYPLVETLTAIVFVLLWDGLFVGRVLRNTGDPAADWPAALAFATLFAGLMASAVMDIREYLIDVRVTNAVMAAGIVCHALWGAVNRDPVSQRFGPTTASVGAALLLGWLGTSALARVLDRRRRPAAEPSEPGGEPDATGVEAAARANNDEAGDAAIPGPAWSVWLALATLIALVVVVATSAGASGWALGPVHQRGAAGIFVLLVASIAAGMQPRPSDEAVLAVIHAEQPQARTTALRELAWLLPSIGLAGATLVTFVGCGWTGASWSGPTLWLGDRGAAAMAGAGSAAASMMLAAAVGWFVRIFFTLLFGKEAYGIGDIYLMAAIGAVGGLWLALISFFLGAVLALVGVAAFALRKRARALPFGPWLALGALGGLWVHDGLVEYFGRSISGLRSMLAGG